MSGTKRIIKNSIMMYGVMFCSIIVGFYTSKIMLSTLGVDDFGIYSLIGGLVILFTFINGSMSGAVQRFLSTSLGKDDFKKTTEYFNASIIVHIGIALLVLIAGKIIGEWLLINKLSVPEFRTQAAYWVLQATLMAFVFQILSTPAQAMLVSYELMGTLALITFLTPVGRLVAILIAGAMVNHDPLTSFAVIIMFSSLLQLLLFYSYAKSKCNACKFEFSRDVSKYRELMSFAGWGLWGELASVAKGQGAAIILNLFFGTIANASYGISNQLISNFKNLSTMVTRAAAPQIIKNFAVGHTERTFKLVTQLSKVSFSILFIFSLPFLLQTNFILTVWLTDVPRYAVTFSKLAIIVALIEISARPLMILSRATGKIKLYQASIGAIFLSSVPLAYVLLENGRSAESVFYVFILIAILTLFVRLVILQITAGLSMLTFLKEVYLKAVVLLVIVLALAHLPINYFSWDIVSVRIFHIFIVPGVATFLAVFCMLTKSERSALLQIVKKK